MNNLQIKKDKRRLQDRRQLMFMVQHGSGLWHHDQGLQRFYYAQENPVSLNAYIGVEHVSCALPGTKPVGVSPTSRTVDKHTDRVDIV